MANRIQIDITANDNASPVFQKIQSAANGVGKTTQEAAEGGLDQFSNGLLRGVAGGVLFANGATVIGEKTAEIAKALIEDGLALQTNQAQLEAWGGVSTTTSANITRAFVAQSGSVRESASEQIGALAEVAPRLELVSGHTLTVAEATKEMSAATDLADASGQKLTTTTGALASIQTTYKLSTDQAKQAAGELLAITELTGAPMDDVAATVGRLHDRTGSATPSLHDMGVLLVQMEQQGVTGSRGLMAVSAAAAQLLSGTPEVNAQLQLLHVNLYNADGSAKPLTEDLKNIAVATAGLTDKQRQAVETTILGTGAANAFDGVIKNYQADIPKATKVYEEHTNLVEQADIRNRTATAGWEKAGAAVKNAAGEVDLWVGSNGELLKQLATHLPVTFLGTATLEAMGAAKAFEILHPDLSKTIDLMERTGSRIAETMHTEETAVSSSVGSQVVSLDQFNAAREVAAQTVERTAQLQTTMISRSTQDQVRIVQEGAQAQAVAVTRGAEAQVVAVQRAAETQSISVTRAAEDQVIQVQRLAEQQTVAIGRAAEDQSLQVTRAAEDQTTQVARAAEDQSLQVSREAENQTTQITRAAEQQAIQVSRAAQQQETEVVRAAQQQAVEVARAAEDQNKASSRAAEDESTAISRSAESEATSVARAAEDQIDSLKRVQAQRSELALTPLGLDISGQFGDPMASASAQTLQLQRQAQDSATATSRAVQDQISAMRKAGASADEILATQRAAEDRAVAEQRKVQDEVQALQVAAQNARLQSQKEFTDKQKQISLDSFKSETTGNDDAQAEQVKAIKRGAEDRITAIRQEAEDRSKAVKRGAEDDQTLTSRSAQDQTTAIQHGAEDHVRAIQHDAENQTVAIRHGAEDHVREVQRDAQHQTIEIQRGAQDHEREIQRDAQNQTIAIQQGAQDHAREVAIDAQNQTIEIQRGAQDHVREIQIDAQNQTIAIQQGAQDHVREIQLDMDAQTVAIQRKGEDHVNAVRQTAQDEIAAIKALEPDGTEVGGSLGQAITSGMVSGMLLDAPALQDAARKVVDDAIAAGKAQAGAHSPSTVAASEIGVPISQGIAQGISSGQSLVNGAVTDVVSGAFMSAATSLSGLLSGFTSGAGGGGGSSPQPAGGTASGGVPATSAQQAAYNELLSMGQNVSKEAFVLSRNDLAQMGSASAAAELAAYMAAGQPANWKGFDWDWANAHGNRQIVPRPGGSSFASGGILPEDIFGMGLQTGSHYNLHASERVLSPEQTRAYDAGGAQPNITLILDGEDVTKHVTVRMETARRAELASVGAA